MRLSNNLFNMFDTRVWWAGSLAIFCLVTVLGVSFVNGKVNASAPVKEFTIQPQRAQRVLMIEGQVMPKSELLVSAAFDTFIQDVHVVEGQRVAIGDALATLDLADIEAKVRRAEIALIKAKEALANLEHWLDSKAVKQARRALRKAEQQARRQSEKTKATEGLYAEGIIPRAELEADKQALADQRDTVIQAQEEYESVVAQGNAQKKRVAALELQNAQAEFDDLVNIRDGNIIRSQINGVVEGVEDNQVLSNATNKFPSIGQKVTAGSPLFTLKTTDDLIIKAKLNEVKAADLSLGQTGVVTSEAAPGLALPARISNIASRALRDPASNDLYPKIAIEAAFQSDASKDALAQLRPGGSVFLEVTINVGDKVILIPPKALRFNTQEAYVTLKTADGQLQPRPVRIGSSFDGAIQVTSGVKVGDVLVVPN